jgi:hypothetical protein
MKLSYRSHKRILRQTLHNRKKQKLNDSTDENSQHLENINNSSSNEETDERLDSDHGHSCHVDAPIPNSDISSFTNECPEPIHDLESQQTYVFPGSSLTVGTSNMLLRSFMCRHHLTHRAKSDLLQLLQIHLPEESQVPPSLYLFEKKCSENLPGCSPEVTEHYYCSACNASLTGPGGSGCSQECCPSHNSEVK